MTVSIATFRQSYPEFDAINYPDSVLTYYLALSTLMLNSNRWGQGAVTAVSPPTSSYDMGTELFVAHHIALERKALNAAKNNGVPGNVEGPTASKSVGPISVSYDTGAVIELAAGHWNLTVYGLRFIKLARMFGAGPLQIGVSCGSTGIGAWPGPMPGWPGWGWT
jgi:hypothetical protein